MKSKFFIIYLLCVCALMACRETKRQEPAQQYATEFTSCYVEQYGKVYDSVPHNVFALDLYSDGLSLDSTRRIVGTGTNLYISDIFLADSLLAVGAYHSDTTAVTHTFLPGQDFEGTPTGIYLFSVVESANAGVQVVDSGRFEVSLTPDSLYNMHFMLYYGKQTYEGRFEGTLNYYDRR